MHFTYAESDGADLQQGDLLSLTPGIREMLRVIHPHYANHSDYCQLVVLTQTCDLVRRKGAPPKAPYITLAAVRPLRTALMREAQPTGVSDAERQAGVCSEGLGNRVKFFLERLLNNNEERYFFFAREPGVLDDDVVAFLQLSIAVKSDLHYETCVRAKILQLAPVFQAKLGYLVGRLYARVGTDDWFPAVDKTEGAFRKRIANIFDRHLVTVPDVIWKPATKALSTEPTMTGARLMEVIREIAESQPSREEFAKYVTALVEGEILKPGYLQLDERGRQKLIERLRSDPGLGQFLRAFVAPQKSTVSSSTPAGPNAAPSPSDEGTPTGG